MDARSLGIIGALGAGLALLYAKNKVGRLNADNFRGAMGKYQIIPDYIAPGTKRRSGAKLRAVRFVVAHDTGNPGTRASGNVHYYKGTANNDSASAHIFVDDVKIIECVPALTTDTPEKAWHVRYNAPAARFHHQEQANDYAIGVEYCYGNGINADEAYRRYVWTLAHLCHKFSLDPARDIVAHSQLDPGRKTDPDNGLSRSGRNFQQLLRDVAAELQTFKGA